MIVIQAKGRLLHKIPPREEVSPNGIYICPKRRMLPLREDTYAPQGGCFP